MEQNDIAIPTLPSRSLGNTLLFYGKLGFDGKVLGAGDSYAILKRGNLELHFFLHADLRPAKSSVPVRRRAATIRYSINCVLRATIAAICFQR